MCGGGGHIMSGQARQVGERRENGVNTDSQTAKEKKDGVEGGRGGSRS